MEHVIRTERGTGAELKQKIQQIHKEKGHRTEEKRSGKAVKKGSYPLDWLTLSFTYDQRNRLIKVEDSLGAAMEYTYDCLNNKASEKAKINETTYQYTRYEYDEAGRLIKTIQSVDLENLLGTYGVATIIGIAGKINQELIIAGII